MSHKLICHVDMNSYFASVEQQANPFFRHRPVAVCAYLHPHGCIIAASVEAKRMGIKVGMVMSQAQHIVPGIICVQNDPPKYRAVTSKIFALLHALTDTIEHYSIDEAFLDLTGWYRDAAEAAFALSRIKQRLHTDVGEWLRCSIGIAPTKFLAKFASDRCKPDGLTIIDQDTISIWLDVPVQEACGIGPQRTKRLACLGITTLLDLRRASPMNLLHVFGKQGFFLWCRVQGIECDPFIPSGVPPKSIGHSYCVPRRISREGSIEAVLTKLTERVGRRLRSHHLQAGRIVVGVHGVHEKRYRHTAYVFTDPVDHSSALISAAISLFRELCLMQEVDFLSVTCIDLQKPSTQSSFTMGVSSRGVREERLRSVSRSLDHIRDRYGEEAIVFGRMFTATGDGHAPDRIGFRKVDGVAVSEFPVYDNPVSYVDVE